MTQTPDKVLNTSDPGDDTQLRYRYQAMRAACYLLALFDDEEDIDEIFCEHHEDVLVKYKNGQCKGIQVKTRDSSGEPFKATDEPVIKSIGRFIDEHLQYPGSFSAFAIESNLGFWKVKDNGNSLPYILKSVRDNVGQALPLVVNQYTAKLCPDKKNTQRLTAAREVLNKLQLSQHSPLGDENESLVTALAQCPVVGSSRLYAELSDLAKALISEVSAASSKACDTPKKSYFAVCSNAGQAQEHALINSKRFNRARVEAIFERVPRYDFSSIKGKVPETKSKQLIKMTAGGVCIDDIDVALAQRQGMESTLAEWLHKYGRRAAENRYAELSSAVLTASSEAKAEVVSSGTPYGAKLLQAMNGRLRLLARDYRESLYGARPDQLMGVAGILTNECRLWWSDKFEIEDAETGS